MEMMNIIRFKFVLIIKLQLLDLKLKIVHRKDLVLRLDVRSAAMGDV